MKEDVTHELLIEALKRRHAAPDESWPDQIHLVDAGGNHRISAVIADEGVALTVAWVSEDNKPVIIQFFTSESLRALRAVCDEMLSRGPMVEDRDTRCSSV